LRILLLAIPTSGFEKHPACRWRVWFLDLNGKGVRAAKRLGSKSLKQEVFGA
jgi:hypothetical protein